MSRPPGRRLSGKAKERKGASPLPKGSPPASNFAHPSPSSPVSQAHLFPPLTWTQAYLRWGRRTELRERQPVQPRAPRPGPAARPGAPVRPLGPSPSPPPHFLCGPAGGGPPAPPGGRPGGAGRAPGGSGSERRRWEGPAGRAPGAWPRCLRHCPHLAGGAVTRSRAGSHLCVQSGISRRRPAPLWDRPQRRSPTHSLGLGFACLRAARATQVPQCDSEFLLTGPWAAPSPPGSPPGSRPAVKSTGLQGLPCCEMTPPSGFFAEWRPEGSLERSEHSLVLHGIHWHHPHLADQVTGAWKVRSC